VKKHKRINYGKVLLVIFITVLIWVWADTAQDIQWEVENILIKADRSSWADSLLMFEGKPSIALEQLVLRGPNWRINDLKNDYHSGSLRLEFFLSPTDVGMAESGQTSINLLDFIKNSGQLRDFGVSAVDCKPKTLSVEVSRLVERQLTVRCLRENRELLKPKSIEPATIKMRVPELWGPERLVADVILTNDEIEQARAGPYEKPAFVTFSSNEQRPVPEVITIQMPPSTEDLKQYTITGATIGFVLSANLVGRYDPVLLNYPELASFTISATPAAKAAYEGQAYQILLYILDDDAQKSGENRKEVVYNFPAESVREDNIKLNQPREIARFKLEPRSPGPAPVGAP